MIGLRISVSTMLAAVGMILCGTPLWAGSTLFGQAETPDWASSLVTRAIEALGPLMILGWYLYYNVSVAMPKKDEIISSRLAAFQSLHNEQIVAYQTEGKEAREMHQRIIDTIMARVDRQNEALMEVIRSCRATREAIGGHKD